MVCFGLGELVRVEGLPRSEWGGMRGIIVVVLPHTNPDGSDAIYDYVVQFGVHRRWFRAADLVRSTREPFARFLRGELLNRYTQLSPGEVARLGCQRDEVAAFLRDRYGFTIRRAQKEVDDLFVALRHRIELATASLVSQIPRHVDDNDSPIALQE